MPCERSGGGRFHFCCGCIVQVGGVAVQGRMAEPVAVALCRGKRNPSNLWRLRLPRRPTGRLIRHAVCAAAGAVLSVVSGNPPLHRKRTAEALLPALSGRRSVGRGLRVPLTLRSSSEQGRWYEPTPAKIGLRCTFAVNHLVPFLLGEAERERGTTEPPADGGTGSEPPVSPDSRREPDRATSTSVHADSAYPRRGGAGV